MLFASVKSMPIIRAHLNFVHAIPTRARHPTSISTIHISLEPNLKPSPAKMISKYLTAVTTTFSPFNPRSGKTVRNFLALLPPNARSTMAISIKMLPKAQALDPASLALKFSMSSTSLNTTTKPESERTVLINVLQRTAKKCS